MTLDPKDIIADSSAAVLPDDVRRIIHRLRHRVSDAVRDHEVMQESADTIEAQAAQIADLRSLLQKVETATATGDGLSADETIQINCIVSDKLKGGDQ